MEEINHRAPEWRQRARESGIVVSFLSSLIMGKTVAPMAMEYGVQLYGVKWKIIFI